MHPSDSFTADNSEIFDKHLGHFAYPQGADLLDRTRPLGDWLTGRSELGTWPYARCLEDSPGPETRIRGQHGAPIRGVSFGSQDYLGLAAHPGIREAALRALTEL